MKQLTAGECGFLMLSSRLGDPDRKPLSAAQLRVLAERSRLMRAWDPSRAMDTGDFVSMGYSPIQARRITDLLSDEAVLEYYLQKARKEHCTPITRITDCYPAAVRKRLGLDSPGVLWAKGDLSILDTPKISLVGSRDLHLDNKRFAQEVGRQAALQGYTLVSGNARGSDKTAQNACLAAGGKVISVVADPLLSHSMKENLLYLSEDGFDEEFTAYRALSRNRVIHALGAKTVVAQCNYRIGGTWDGTVKNLRFGWSSVFCFDDGSSAMAELAQMGACLIGLDDLRNIQLLQPDCRNLFDQ